MSDDLCKFLDSLSAEQRAELRKLLDSTEPQPQPKYRVTVAFWDDAHTKIKYLREYLGEKFHGLSRGWHKNGQPSYEDHWENDQLHGLRRGWYSNGQLWYESHWENGHLHGTRKEWNVDGVLTLDEVWKR